MSGKLGKYKNAIKNKEQRLREAFTEAEESKKRISTLEDQADRLLQALKKQRSHEEKLLNDHIS